MKTAIGDLMGIALNAHFAFSSRVILMLIHEREMSFHLLRSSLISFFSDLYFHSTGQPPHLLNLFLGNLIFEAIVNDIDFLI
jgi:hypothetical protein